MPDLELTIISPQGVRINLKNIGWFHARLANGYPITIYPNHAPLIAKIEKCTAKYHHDGIEHLMSFTDGVIRVIENKIICALEDEAVQKEKNDY